MTKLAMPNAKHRYLPGDWVQVRSYAEIAATLDADGKLGGLLFMPEMAVFCGRRFRVVNRAEKTCAVAEVTAIRRLGNAVHLEGIRCNGANHGGCQAGCLVFWREEWLEPTEDDASSDQETVASVPADLPFVTQINSLGAPSRYICQATELWQSTRPLPWHDARQYLRDVATGAVSIRAVASGTVAKARGVGMKLSSKLRSKTKRKTPTETLNLQAGELVEVKSKREILATLDASGKNRGLWWDPEMFAYCGKRYRVLRPLDRIIDEHTGEMCHFKNPAVLLDGVVCTGASHRFCTRAAYVYWREIWLRRVED